MYGGFLVNEQNLTALYAAAANGDAERLFEQLEEHAVVVRPEFTYPPFILTVALSYLRQRNAGFRLPDARELSGALEAAAVEVVLFADPAASAGLLATLSSFRLNDDDFARFFGNEVGEPWESAPAAMAEALTYLKNGLVAAREQAVSLLILLH